MGYFPLSSKKVRTIAATSGFLEVAAYIVLARHATSHAILKLGKYRFSGAGVDAIHRKVGVSEERAKGIMARLKDGGFINEPSEDVKKASAVTRWDLGVNEFDIFLPHNFVDSEGEWDSALRRIKFKMPSDRTGYSRNSADAARLDCLMTLLAVYFHTSMHSFGGLDPSKASTIWSIETREKNDNFTRWGVECDGERWSSGFVSECLIHQKQPGTWSPDNAEKFVIAWNALKKLGLIYEAVSYFTSETPENREKFVFTIRVNDYHANGAESKGDPSFMNALDNFSNTKHYFYTRHEEHGEGASFRLNLPHELGLIKGVWRPRLRPATPDTGKWYESELTAIKRTISLMNLKS